MLVTKHVQQLQSMASRALERRVLYSEIQPVCFGYDIGWSAGATYVLASYQVPENSWMIALRTECFTTNYTSGASDYNLYGAPPPGTAYWIRASSTTTTPASIVTPPNSESHLLLDVDQFLGFQPKQFANLLGVLDAPADGDTRQVRTRVYAYLVGNVIADALLGQVSVYSSV